MHTGFWWGNLKQGDHLEDPGVDVMINSNRFSRRGIGGGGARSGLIWLRIRNSVMKLRVP